MIGVLIAVLLAAVVYFICVALGLPAIVGIVAAILVLISGIARVATATGAEESDLEPAERARW